jgi:hypothetical protein
MAQITLEYDEKDKSAKKFLEAFLLLPFFKVKTDCPYDEEFMKTIDQSRRDYKEGKYKVIDTDNLWK